MAKRKTKEDFIAKAREVHEGKYDYSKVYYTNTYTKVCITCPEHGDFLQIPKDHLKGHGCVHCSHIPSSEDLLNKQDAFIKKARMVHGERYDYSRVSYKGAQEKVCIICPKHGEFWQTPNNHTNGQGCYLCYREGIRSLCFGVGILDRAFDECQEESEYRWYCILRRVYYNQDEENYAYKDCHVCEEWLTYSNFKKWYDEYHIDDWEIDKDILVKGNKVYGPQTCCFVPQEINKLFVKRQNHRGKYPIGVQYNTKHSYSAIVNMWGKSVYLGSFKTPEEAFKAYKVAKEAYIKEVADKYKEKLDPRVYKALYEYQVEITD